MARPQSHFRMLGIAAFGAGHKIDSAERGMARGQVRLRVGAGGPRRRDVQPRSGQKVLPIVDRGGILPLKHADRGVEIGDRGIDAALRQQQQAAMLMTDGQPAGKSWIDVERQRLQRRETGVLYERIASSTSPCRPNASPRLSQHAARPNA